MDLLKRFQIEMAIKEDRKMLPEFKEMAKLLSEKMKAYYDGLIAAGFTEEQALAIVRDHGIDAGRVSWIDNSGGEHDGD